MLNATQVTKKSNGSGQTTGFYGITAPISTAIPTEEDEAKNTEFLRCIEQYNVSVSEGERLHRWQVLEKLSNFFLDWIRDISLEKGLPEIVANEVGGKLFTFGSFKLGVDTPGADIDTLCVAPRHIDRDEMFTKFAEQLRQLDGVTDVRVVANAFVPVMKIKMEDVELDILFARLSLQRVPSDHDLRDPSDLKNLDLRCVRSLNGYRVTTEIMNLVPNQEQFKNTLKAIKLWAKRKGIYSNVLGYLGGVSWALLVARVCQLYPNALAATLVAKFFLVYSKWQWPRPILLRALDPLPGEQELGFQVWDPRVNPADKYHLMPIVTPAYPQQNSTFNVTKSTKEVIVREISSARETADSILKGNLPWDRLFDPSDFFIRYRHYIMLKAYSYASQQFGEWTGLVESKVRLLVQELEKNPYIQLAVVFPQSVGGREEVADSSSAPQNGSAGGREMVFTKWFIGLELNKAENQKVDLTFELQTFVGQLRQNALANFEHYNEEETGVEPISLKRKQLEAHLSDQQKAVLKELKAKARSQARSQPNVSAGPDVPTGSKEVGRTGLAHSESESSLINYDVKMSSLKRPAERCLSPAQTAVVETTVSSERKEVDGAGTDEADNLEMSSKRQRLVDHASTPSPAATAPSHTDATPTVCDDATAPSTNDDPSANDDPSSTSCALEPAATPPEPERAAKATSAKPLRRSPSAADDVLLGIEDSLPPPVPRAVVVAAASPHSLTSSPSRSPDASSVLNATSTSEEVAIHS